MKISLANLPTDRQAELRQITDTIVQAIHPEKIILFGSYATGRWVADKYVAGHITYEYQSDFDILVVTSRGEKREDHQVEEMLESKCQHLTSIPVNIIAHGIDYANKQIGEGQYFFTDIKKEGILLWDAGKVELAEQRELTPAEKKEIVERDFKKWFSTSKEFLKRASILDNNDSETLNISAFLLHQATERTYNTMILVFTGYKPKTHNIAKLIKMSRDFSPELATIFPNNSKEEKHLFTLLKKAYIDARYSEDYMITEKELKALIERVKRLQEVTERVCRKKIEEF